MIVDRQLKNLIKNQFIELKQRVSGMCLTFRRNDAIITGPIDFRIEDITNSPIFVYHICILISDKYPNVLPAVKEFSGKVSTNFHTNPNGDLCLGVISDMWLKLGKPLTLLNYVERCVVPFLYFAIQKEQMGMLPHGERSHGGRGIYEFYREYLECSDQEQLLQILSALRNNSWKSMLTCLNGRDSKIALLLKLVPKNQIDSEIDMILSSICKRLKIKKKVQRMMFYGNVHTAMLADFPKLQIRLGQSRIHGRSRQR